MGCFFSCKYIEHILRRESPRGEERGGGGSCEGGSGRSHGDACGLEALLVGVVEEDGHVVLVEVQPLDRDGRGVPEPGLRDALVAVLFELDLDVLVESSGAAPPVIEDPSELGADVFFDDLDTGAVFAGEAVAAVDLRAGVDALSFEADVVCGGSPPRRSGTRTPARGRRHRCHRCTRRAG